MLRKRDGAVLTYVHDNLNRVVAKIVPERPGLTAAQTRDVYYDYNNAMGLQTKARFDNLDGHGVTNYYDAFGQRTTILTNMDGHFRYVSYYHDDSGNLVRLTHPDGVEYYYGHDALGRLTQVQESAASASIDQLVIRYWYKPQGGRHAAVRGAGNGGFSTIFYYDALQRPYVHYNMLPTPGNNVDLVFGYNRASQIVERTVTNDAYAAPPPGSVARGYQVNGLNQYTGTTHNGAPNWSFEYDPNGNLTRSVDPSGAGTMAFVYDVENRLVSASNGASLVYDPLGRLFQVSGGAAGTTRFLYDGDRMIAEYDAAGTLLKRYAHGQGADDPVMVHEGPGVGLAGRRYMLPDEKGSIMALVDADGTPAVKNRYDPWGMRGADNDGRFQYTGQAWIPELGLYYYKARMYSPFLGRFMQTDPIGYEDQMNLYAYVGNDPINKYDSQGKWSRDVHNRIFERALTGRVTAAGIRQIQNVSLHQDIGPNANRMYMHYLRLPGQDTGSASRQFRSYLTGELAAAKDDYKKGNENAAINRFARAAHAIADYYSPAHRESGQPKEYDPDWNPIQAAMNGHSPMDSVGREGTDDLTGPTENRIVEETEKAFDQVFGSEKKTLVSCIGSRIMRTQC